MAEICAVFLVKPWFDRTRPRPDNERIMDIEIPSIKANESSHQYVLRCKSIISKTIDSSKYDLRSSPSIVADRQTMDAAVVCYVHQKGPAVDEIKRKPIKRQGVAARIGR